MIIELQYSYICSIIYFTHFHAFVFVSPIPRFRVCIKWNVGYFMYADPQLLKLCVCIHVSPTMQHCLFHCLFTTCLLPVTSVHSLVIKLMAVTNKHWEQYFNICFQKFKWPFSYYVQSYVLTRKCVTLIYNQLGFFFNQSWNNLNDIQDNFSSAILLYLSTLFMNENLNRFYLH